MDRVQMIAKRRSLGGWWLVSPPLAVSVAAASGDGRLAEAVKNKDSKAVELLLKEHAEGECSPSRWRHCTYVGSLWRRH